MCMYGRREPIVYIHVCTVGQYFIYTCMGRESPHVWYINIYTIYICVYTIHCGKKLWKARIVCKCMGSESPLYIHVCKMVRCVVYTYIGRKCPNVFNEHIYTICICIYTIHGKQNVLKARVVCTRVGGESSLYIHVHTMVRYIVYTCIGRKRPHVFYVHIYTIYICVYTIHCKQNGWKARVVCTCMGGESPLYIHVYTMVQSIVYTCMGRESSHVLYINIHTIHIRVYIIHCEKNCGKNVYNGLLPPIHTLYKKCARVVCMCMGGESPLYLHVWGMKVPISLCICRSCMKDLQKNPNLFCVRALQYIYIYIHIYIYTYIYLFIYIYIIWYIQIYVI